jgi:acetyl-CoA synthetase (ADP-forming)/acetyltransferase
VALVGLTLTNPKHWTRTFYQSLLEFGYPGRLYPVNRGGGEINGLKVWPSLSDIPGEIDYVISLVPAGGSEELITHAAAKGVKVIHFCTAGFSEVDLAGGTAREAELVRRARDHGIRVIGPNCMGLYCPSTGLAFQPQFPRESGPIGMVSQSGGNAIDMITQASHRGVRFSKVISYGNGADLNESDFLEYLAGDPETRAIVLYIEGVKDGRRFRQALEKASREKMVILLKGGLTESGTRAAAGHTGALAGQPLIWEALSRQVNLIPVFSMAEAIDLMAAVQHGFLPRGRRVGLLGTGGGASVLIADAFERQGLVLPPLPAAIKSRLLEFSHLAGNILENPIDYSQTAWESDKLAKAVKIVGEWEDIDSLLCFPRPGWQSPGSAALWAEILYTMLSAGKGMKKPVAVLLEPGITPAAALQVFPLIEKSAQEGFAVFYSFVDAARAIRRLVDWGARRHV